jgi:hypothetical protein
MENFEKNPEKVFSPERKEQKESNFEIKSNRELTSKSEKQEQPAFSALTNTKESKSTGSVKISPIISKKMQCFLDLAEEKGLSAAIKAVEKENDPLLLDSFHDALAKEKLFEDFLKKKKK